MTTIVSSIIGFSNPQVDGRFCVHEIHTDDSGSQYIFDYIADAKINQNAHLSSDAAQLNTQFQYFAANAVAIAQSNVVDAQQAVTNAQASLVSAQAVLAIAQTAHVQSIGV